MKKVYLAHPYGGKDYNVIWSSLLYTIVIGLMIGVITIMVLFISEPIEYAKSFKEAIKILKGEGE